MTTPNLGLTLPTVGADSDAWGTEINTDLTTIDNAFGSATAKAFNTVGTCLVGAPFTWTDSTTAAGTVASAYGSSQGAVTFATATNAITITDAYGKYCAAPVAGSHVTITNAWALGADSAKINGLLVASQISAGFSGFYAATDFVSVNDSTGTAGVRSMSVRNASTNAAAGAVVYVAGSTSVGYIFAASPNNNSFGLNAANEVGLANTAGPTSLTGTGTVYARSGGSGGVQLTSGGTSWGAISDYRAKNVQGDFTDAGAVIDAVPVHLAAFKTEPDIVRPMFLAHEIQASASYAVVGAKDAIDADGNPIYQVLQSTDPLVPILWAALKDLRADFAAYKATHP